MKKRILTFMTAIALVLTALSRTAMAATITPSETSIQLDAGETSVTFDITIQENAPFAGAEFGLKASGSDVKFESLKFLDVSGESVVQTEKDGTVYFGFFAGTNKFNGTYKVAQVTYSYTGKSPASISLTYSQVVTLDAEGETHSDENSQRFTVNLSRKAGGEGTEPDPVRPVIPSNPGTPTQPSKTVFKDVTEGTFYYNAVYWAVKQGITKGTSDDLFSPGNDCTRAEAVTFLWRLAGSPKPTTKTCPFIDVVEGSYYYNAMLWGLQNGIIQGTSHETFSPDMLVSRGQFVTMLWRYAKWPDPITAKSPFNDVTVPGEYYYNAVLWAVENEITLGTSEITFGPDTNCSRGQVVTFLYRYASSR